MRRIALLLAGIGLVVAGSVGPTAATAKEPAVVHTTAELAVVGGEIQQPKLAWLQPQTLKQLKRGVVKLDGAFAAVMSPTRARVAVGTAGAGLAIVDVKRMKRVTRVAPRPGWSVHPISWPTANRLLALEWNDRVGGQQLLVANPASRRAVKRVPFDGFSTWARAGSSVVAVGGSLDSIGPAKVLVVDENGATRSVQLDRIQAGGVMEGSGEEPTYRMASPGLAVDPAFGHAYVVGQDGLVADIDLTTLAVSHREVNRPASLFGRFLDWLQPTAHAKRQMGWQRQAVSLGKGKLAVAGSDFDGFVNHPSSGLELFDLGAGTRRTLEAGASYVQASSGVLLAAGGSWDGQTEKESGIGLAAYSYDGEQLWRALGDEAVWWFQVAGGYVYVGGKDAYPPTVRVIDLADGGTNAVRGQLPFFVTG